ncbi:4'-phosphopantetheinyl transferase superfamily protein [Myroides odoratimimus]|uniref:4'-phosphopantetheinyl transferase family protein n=1 Tax=Myroides odoratimimus TaxID=76832 RepID=UPI0010408B75|nr:4'-phosphopantetheinyl transferase superfamily protein [Myroides odoratimimus]MCA4791626.1 4'-phosphopantetheinyl transferase superfamily protein [Myroides odoratimimus]MCA4806067.1 4'-phosphopantetheinyl transferase superfamily protein [Myroides odoratimimus]MCA4818887.1 4'-phosphopantetheinyl transferase superfamily protein [Myroides odoratimimus]MCO7722157.1 4'-phosphopantetheinyl transferase superfamily protein [Myroides odoratimimus]MDM1057688.1 4'-phosphopantetheinyl transferase super
MPLVKEIKGITYKVLVWKVEENLEELMNGVVLQERSSERLKGMKSEVHQRGFMAVRQLLYYGGYSDNDLCYDINGRPSLSDGSFISISHSFEYASIIIGKENVGIDVEKKRDKIKRIANKFCNEEELNTAFNALDEIDTLTEIWCAKEAMFKMCESRSLSFKSDMQVELKTKECFVNNEIFNQKFEYKTIELDNFVLVYALES